MALIHYAKREYETVFVHVFSRYTMPFQRVFINCIHYWVFFALLNAVELYMFPSGHTYPSWLIYSLLAVWTVFEFCNYKCHVILSSFRRNKEKTDKQENASKKRGIPYGWGFDIVSCANYFWEALGWIAFSILTRTWTSYFFTVASIYQMTVWALKKHKTYKEEFGDKYPRGRKAIFPFIV
jgi:very-long-chain enoyl-CoA reductase